MGQNGLDDDHVLRLYTYMHLFAMLLYWLCGQKTVCRFASQAAGQMTNKCLWDNFAIVIVLHGLVTIASTRDIQSRIYLGACA